MYKKCGILVFSIPGLEIIECCISSNVNNPKALFTAAPKSPRLVQISVISPFAKASSKFILFVLLHKIFLTPGNEEDFQVEHLPLEELFVYLQILLNLHRSYF